MADKPKNPDRHKTPSGVLGRPDPELRDQAQRILTEHDWTMNQFLIACLVLLTKNPKALLARLAEYKPALRWGRPPKAR